MGSGLTISEMSDLAYKQAVTSGFESGPKRSVGDCFMLMVTELAEAMEEFRSGFPINEIYYKDGKPEGVPIELADVVIRIGNFCGANGIDLEEAVCKKMDFNRTRPYRHGGKKL